MSAGVTGASTDVELSPNADVLLRERYLRRDAGGRVVETPAELFDRVAGHVAAAETEYGGDPARWAEEFAAAMRSLVILPSSPVLMNAGTSLGFLSACVVLPVEDTLHSIFAAVRDMALVHQSGGEEAVLLAGRIASVLQHEAAAESEALAVVRGPFPSWPASTFAKRSARPRRNAQLTSIAPTGSISTIAGTTAGIEPLFALAYSRHVLGRRLVEIDRHFQRAAAERGFGSEALLRDIVARGTVQGDGRVPDDVRRLFVTALDIAPDWHLRVQAAFQQCVDEAVSKTVNLPTSSTPEDVLCIFISAWHASAKGITVYRHGSRPDQVLRIDALADTSVEIDLEYAGGCAASVCEVQ
jgi:ribonucleotide reductase alpha subunit